MRLLCISRRRPGVQSPEVHKLNIVEAARAWALIREGVFLSVNFDASRPCAIVTMEAPSEAEARRILGTLPAVEAGLLDFEVYHLGVYTQLEHLMRPEHQPTKAV